MNYLIIEAYTDANIGSGALVENSVKLLTESLKVPKSNIRIMAHYPSVFEDKYNVKSVPDIFKFPFNQKRLKQSVWLFKTILWMLISWLFPSMAIKSKRWSDYRWADVVISVGAERINDKYIKNELFSLFTYAIVKKFGKKMVLFPSTYGPFLYKFTYKLSKKVFSSLDLIYARDQKSFNTLKSFDLDESKIINTSDVAIFQEWDTCFIKYSFENNLPIVGVSVLKWTYVANKYETPYSNYETYVREI